MIRAAVNNMRRYKPGQTWDQVGKGLGDAWAKQNPSRAQALNPGMTGGTAANATGYNTPAAATGGGGLPTDSAYEATLGRIRSGLNATNAMTDAEENALGTDYGVGFDREVDPQTGLSKLTHFRLDLSSPHSKAALLQKAFDQGQKATSGQLASRGQLYSGYLQSKLEQGREQHEQGKHDLLSGFGGLASQIWQRRFGAWQGAQGEKEGALDALVGRNTSKDPEPAPAPAPAAQTAQQILQDPSKPWAGRPQKWTAKGLFYQRADGKWIPMSGVAR